MTHGLDLAIHEIESASCSLLGNGTAVGTILIFYIEQEFWLPLDVVFDLELVQVEHHVLEHVDGLVLGLA